MKKRKIIKKISLAILLFIIAAAVILVAINVLTRQEFKLHNKQRKQLEKIYPGEQLDKIHFYKYGWLSSGTSMAFGNSIYLSENRIIKPTQWQPYEAAVMSTLVHEIAHTCQYPNIIVGAERGLNSYYYNFKSIIQTGSRHSAYQYSIYQTKYNTEQEASIVADYYKVKYGGYKKPSLCIDCSEENAVEELKIKVNKFFEKYHIQKIIE